MAPNATLKTSFNPFIVHDNMNDNNQDPDLNFFHESVSLRAMSIFLTSFLLKF